MNAPAVDPSIEKKAKRRERAAPAESAGIQEAIDQERRECTLALAAELAEAVADRDAAKERVAEKNRLTVEVQKTLAEARNEWVLAREELDHIVDKIASIVDKIASNERGPRTFTWPPQA